MDVYIIRAMVELYSINQELTDENIRDMARRLRVNSLNVTYVEALSLQTRDIEVRAPEMHRVLEQYCNMLSPTPLHLHRLLTLYRRIPGASATEINKIRGLAIELNGVIPGFRDLVHNTTRPDLLEIIGEIVRQASNTGNVSYEEFISTRPLTQEEKGKLVELRDIMIKIPPVDESTLGERLREANQAIRSHYENNRFFTNEIIAQISSLQLEAWQVLSRRQLRGLENFHQSDLFRQIMENFILTHATNSSPEEAIQRAGEISREISIETDFREAARTIGLIAIELTSETSLNYRLPPSYQHITKGFQSMGIAASLIGYGQYAYEIEGFSGNHLARHYLFGYFEGEISRGTNFLCDISEEVLVRRRQSMLQQGYNRAAQYLLMAIKRKRGDRIMDIARYFDVPSRIVSDVLQMFEQRGMEAANHYV